jgi:hypothetical protein
MAPTAMSPARAEFVGNVYADSADQYLISYLILTRFPESSPYALGFVLAHCLEVSIKAAFFQVKGQAPPTGQKGHLLEELIELLPNDLKKELKSHLPDISVREHFDREVNRMNEAPPDEMLRTFFAINPEFDDDVWTMLYATFHSVDIRYGADAKQRVLQMMPPDNPKLTKMALRLIASAREHFPRKEDHRRTIAAFIDKLPTRYDLVAELKKLAETGTAQDTPAYITGDAPPPPLMFDSAELELIRRTFGLPSKAP